MEDIIVYARSQGTDDLIPVLAVLAQIGGGRAEAFLQWAAHFHRDRRIREEASKLLERVQTETPRETIPVPVMGPSPQREPEERQPQDRLPGKRTIPNITGG